MGRVSDAKQRILDATIELVWRSSYGAVTLDAVCQRAGVRKGSLYYFFKSKAELVAAALEHQWQTTEVDLARLFAPSVPPLQRLQDYFAFCHAKQADLAAEAGRVLGCPYMSIGCEVNREEALVCAKAEELIQRHIRYLETAIQEAMEDGALPAGDAAGKARGLFAYIEGVLTQARIQNNAELIRELSDGGLRFLGAAAPLPKRAKRK